MSLVADDVFSVVRSRIDAMVGTTVLGIELVDVPVTDAAGAISPEHGLCIVQAGDAERFEAYDYPGNPPAQAWQQEIRIAIFVRDEESSIDWGRLCMAFGAAVRKAVAGAGADWYTLGGSAVDCDWGTTLLGDSDGGIRVVTVPLFVIYRHADNDPEAKR